MKVLLVTICAIGFHMRVYSESYFVCPKDESWSVALWSKYTAYQTCILRQCDAVNVSTMSSLFIFLIILITKSLIKDWLLSTKRHSLIFCFA